MNTLLDLSRWATRTRDNLKEEVNRYTQKYITELLLELVDKTPVDTSEALSNWQINLNSPVGSAIEPYVPGREGSTQAESARAAYDAGIAIIKTRRVGDVVYVSNLAEHIVYLNNGTSLQAPAGFIEIAILTAEQRMKGIEIKLV